MIRTVSSEDGQSGEAGRATVAKNEWFTATWYAVMDERSTLMNACAALTENGATRIARTQRPVIGVYWTPLFKAVMVSIVAILCICTSGHCYRYEEFNKDENGLKWFHSLIADHELQVCWKIYSPYH